MKDALWLTHLRRDRCGLPVPYINLWGTEDEARMTVAYDPHVRMDAVFLDDSAEETPDFTRQNMGRQRECMVRGLCQVCATPVPWSRRFLVLGDLSIERITVQGREVAVVTEPWLDERCARFAVEVCPGLIRRNRAERLLLVKVTSQRQAELTVSRGWIDGRLEEQTRRNPVAMWAKIILSGYAASQLPEVARV